MDASGSGCWCDVCPSCFSSSSRRVISYSLHLRCSPLCSYTLLFTTSCCQKAAFLRDPPPSTFCMSRFLFFFFFLHPLTLHFLLQPLHFSLTHSYSGLIILFFCHTLLISSCLLLFFSPLLSRSLVLFFCFLFCWFPFSPLSAFGLSYPNTPTLYTSLLILLWFRFCRTFPCLISFHWGCLTLLFFQEWLNSFKMIWTALSLAYTRCRLKWLLKLHLLQLWMVPVELYRAHRADTERWS